MNFLNPYIFCKLEPDVEKEKTMLQQCCSGRLSYTYLIEARNKLYIGSRLCPKGGVLPHEDINYLGSSKCKEYKSIPKTEKKKYILEVFLDHNDAIEHEIILHREYKVRNNPIFWNKAEQTSTGFLYDSSGITPVNKGKKHSLEARRKMSESRRGEKNPNYGKKLPLEYRRKISESNKGKHTGEKNGFFGKKHTEESKKRITEALIGVHIGSKNPHYDATLRDWCHKEGVEELQISTYDLVRKYQLHQGHISQVINGRLKSHKGWSLKE